MVNSSARISFPLDVEITPIFISRFLALLCRGSLSTKYQALEQPLEAAHSIARRLAEPTAKYLIHCTSCLHRTYNVSTRDGTGLLDYLCIPKVYYVVCSPLPSRGRFRYTHPKPPKTTLSVAPPKK